MEARHNEKIARLKEEIEKLEQWKEALDKLIDEENALKDESDILADKDDVARCVAGLQGRQGIDDLVVVQVLGQAMVALVVRAHQYR